MSEEPIKKPKLGLVDGQPPAEPTPDPTPKDARDIELLFVDPKLGDGLTNIGLHLIPIDKPKDFFRVNEDPAYRRRLEMYIHKVDGEIGKSYYIIGEKLKGQIEEARDCVVVTCIYRNGNVRLWPIPLPRDGEPDNKAWVSARAAARIAMKKWVKLVWRGGIYQTRDASPRYAPDPKWTKLPPYNDLITTAFNAAQGFMDDEDHAIYREHLSGDDLSDKADDDGI